MHDLDHGHGKTLVFGASMSGPCNVSQPLTVSRTKIFARLYTNGWPLLRVCLRWAQRITLMVVVVRAAMVMAMHLAARVHVQVSTRLFVDWNITLIFCPCFVCVIAFLSSLWKMTLASRLFCTPKIIFHLSLLPFLELSHFLTCSVLREHNDCQLTSFVCTILGNTAW